MCSERTLLCCVCAPVPPRLKPDGLTGVKDDDGDDFDDGGGGGGGLDIGLLSRGL